MENRPRATSSQGRRALAPHQKGLAKKEPGTSANARPVDFAQPTQNGRLFLALLGLPRDYSRQAMSALPAATVRALLAGFGALRLPADEIRRAAGLAEQELSPVDGLVPLSKFVRLWDEAARYEPGEAFATEVGLAVPFGAFGALDYLAATAPTVGAAFHSLAAHFRYAAQGVSLEIEETSSHATVRIINASSIPVPQLSDEFTVAVFVGRFRSQPLKPSFVPEWIQLSRSAPQTPSRHANLLGSPVTFDSSVTAFGIAAQVWNASLPQADATLQNTLHQLAEATGLGGANEAPLELRIRSRLRLLLPEHRATAQEVASSLGLSERSLHRHLQAAGTTYQRVLEAFRETEAERLLLAGQIPLSQVAQRLGFSDQTTWSRAFKRRKGVSPRDWIRSRERR